jgi:hypothetical protein
MLFFKDSYYLWVVTRFGVSSVFLFDLIKEHSLASNYEILRTILGGVYVILLLVMLFQEVFSVRKNELLSRMASGISFLMGAFFVYMFLFEPGANILIVMPLATALILLGAFDFHNIQPPGLREEESY